MYNWVTKCTVLSFTFCILSRECADGFSECSFFVLQFNIPYLIDEESIRNGRLQFYVSFLIVPLLLFTDPLASVVFLAIFTLRSVCMIASTVSPYVYLFSISMEFQFWLEDVPRNWINWGSRFSLTHLFLLMIMLGVVYNWHPKIYIFQCSNKIFLGKFVANCVFMTIHECFITRE